MQFTGTVRNGWELQFQGISFSALVIQFNKFDFGSYGFSYCFCIWLTLFGHIYDYFHKLDPPPPISHTGLKTQLMAH